MSLRGMSRVSRARPRASAQSAGPAVPPLDTRPGAVGESGSRAPDGSYRTPDTHSIRCPSANEKTIGREAVKLYSLLGKIAQEWQELLLYDIMAVNAAGLWVHTKFGYSLQDETESQRSRTICELWGLINGEHIMHTAHRTTTTHALGEADLDGLKNSDLNTGQSGRSDVDD